MTEAVVYRLREGTTWRKIENDAIVFSKEKEVPIRLSAQLIPVLSALKRGATVEETAAITELLSPRGQDHSAIVRLLETLTEFGVVDDGTAPSRRSVHWLVNIGMLTERLRLDKAGTVLSWLVGLLLVSAAVALVQAVFQGAIGNPVAAIVRLEWIPFALVLFLLVPLHELGHVLAALIAGTALGRLGVRISRFLVIRPFIETLPRRGGEPAKATAIVALGGPAMDLFNAGLAGFVAGNCSGAVGAYASTMAGASLLMCFRNMGPEPRKDGFKVLRWLLGENTPLAGTISLRLLPKRYHVYIAAHAFAFLTIMALLIFQAVPWGGSSQ